MDVDFFSSEKTLIVNAGIKNENRIGNREKKFLSSALFARKKVLKNKKPEAPTNSPATMYAIGLEK